MSFLLTHQGEHGAGFGGALEIGHIQMFFQLLVHWATCISTLAILLTAMLKARVGCLQGPERQRLRSNSNAMLSQESFSA